MTDPTVGVPPAQLQLAPELLRQLLREQFPSLARLPVRFLDHGWDNDIFRLGEDLVLRLPRRAMAAKLLENEIRWLPVIAQQTGLRLPLALHAGHPSALYPYPFTIQEYLPGVSAATLQRAERDSYADQLAGFFEQLHVPAPPGAPGSTYRGLGLRLLDASRGLPVENAPPARRPEVVRIWKQALAAPPAGNIAYWLHGDPHPHNVLAKNVAPGSAELSGVIDFGDLCSGDRASDLGVVWLHFSTPVRNEVLQRLGAPIGSALWGRARGWALRYALIMSGMPRQTPLGKVGRESLDLVLNQ